MEKRKGTIKIVSEEQLAQTLSEENESNRRREARIPAEYQVEVPLSLDELKQAYTMNISRGGLTFLIDPPASIPSALDLTLTLPGGNSVTLTCEVRHIAPNPTGGFEVGVQFKKLSDDATQTINTALSLLTH